jgi:secondary thiamine-phosphate synthase enzyme
MKQAQEIVKIRSDGQGLYEITDRVVRWVAAQGLETGLLTLFCRHTSCSLTIQENADPDVQADLLTFFRDLAPEDPRLYRHTIEGPDDMPAHIRSALTDCSLQIPLVQGRLALGAWQGIYLFEHRRAAQERQVVLHLQGSGADP